MRYRPTPGFIATVLVAAIAATLLLTACGGGGDDAPPPDETPVPHGCHVLPRPPECL